MKVGQLVYFRGRNNETLEGRVFNVGKSLLRVAVYAPIDEPPGRELTYHIIDQEEVMIDDEEELNLLDSKEGPNPYISQADVHGLIYMIQAGDTVSAVERLRTWLLANAKPDHIRHVPSQNMDTMRKLHSENASVTEAQFHQLMAPARVAVTPLDFGCSVDIKTMTDRHTPSEALRIVVDASRRFRRKNAASSGFTSGILVNKHWTLHIGDSTEQFLGQPPTAYVESSSAKALQQELKFGRSLDDPSKTMSPQSKVRPRPRPTSCPTESGDSESDQQDDKRRSRSRICKHWVKHTCFHDKCMYLHTGPGGLDPRGNLKGLINDYKKTRAHHEKLVGKRRRY